MPNLTTNITSDGINFSRIGSCNMCGYCCQGCPHFKAGTPNVCLVYATRDQLCKDCGKTHADCITYPVTPFLRCIKDGKCGFSFALSNSKDSTAFNTLNSKW